MADFTQKSVTNSAERKLTTAINTAMDGTPSYDSSGDSFSGTLKCHHSNGENYSNTFKCDSIVVSSYEADAILTTIESWADPVAILA